MIPLRNAMRVAHLGTTPVAAPARASATVPRAGLGVV